MSRGTISQDMRLMYQSRPADGNVRPPPRSEHWRTPGVLTPRHRLALLFDAMEGREWVEPDYPLGERDETIALTRTRARLADEGSGVLGADGQASLRFDWLPTPRVAFELDAGPHAWLDLSTPWCLELPELAGAPKVRALTTQLNPGSDRSRIAGVLNGSVVLGTAPHKANCVRFLVPNMPRTFGDWLTAPDHGHWVGRVVFDTSPWRITVSARPDIDSVVNGLKASRGYAVTHVGELTRVDKSQFDRDDAAEVLRAFGIYLSFAWCGWTPALLPIGYVDGVEAWREWFAPNITPWRNRVWWAPDREPSDLSDGFDSFIRHWTVAGQRESIEFALWWYLEANSGSTCETSLVLAQSALELLAWAVLVERHALKKRRAYKNVDAETKIRDLLAHLGVPPDIPPELPSLKTHAQSEKWQDGPQAVARQRNRLTHGGGKTAKVLAVPISARIELSTLALSYVELALMNYIGYSGRFLHPFRSKTHADLEQTPW